MVILEKEKEYEKDLTTQLIKLWDLGYKNWVKTVQGKNIEGSLEFTLTKKEEQKHEACI